MQNRSADPAIAYITDTFVREPDSMTTARAKGETLRPGMQMSAHETHMLRWLASMHGATAILEIGTFMGVSAMAMAQCGAVVTTLEFNAEYAEFAAQHVAASPHRGRIDIQVSDALAWMAEQPAQPRFDMLFIDAEKRRYPDYLDAAMPLLKPHALIVADNTLLWGAVYGVDDARASAAAIAAMQQFNARLADPLHFDALMIPTAEGLTVARRRS